MKNSISSAIAMIKNYSWNSIFFRYWKKFTLIIMIPFIIVVSIVCFYYIKTMNYEITNYSTRIFLQSSNILRNVIEETQNNYTLFSSNNDVAVFLNYKTIPENNTPAQNIHTLMYNYINIAQYIDSIYLYSVKTDYVLSSRNGNFMKNFDDKQWYEKFLKTDNPKFILPSHKIYDNEKKIISFSYGIYQVKTLVGILVLNLDTSKLDKMILTNSSNEISYSLYTNEGNLIYTTNEYSIYATRPIDNSIKSGNIIYENNRNYVLISSNIEDQFILRTYTNLENYKYNAKMLYIILIICILIALIIPIILSFYISLQFYHGIEKIIVNFHTPENTFEIKKENTDELMFISQNIMNITNKNLSIEEKLVSQISELKKLQSNALQLQLSPHFLFNTLNLISVINMDIAKKDNPASKTITLLSDLLATALNTKEFIVTVEEEIQYAKKYVEIEFIKYNNFDVIWNIDESTLQLKTIKLILQPVIENAFDHGIKYLRNKTRGELIISTYCENNNLIFTTENNGANMSADKLQEVQLSLTTNDMPETKHIGLCNINQRIKLIFGEQYGCSIFTTKLGTMVKITMPIQL